MLHCSLTMSRWELLSKSNHDLIHQMQFWLTEASEPGWSIPMRSILGGLKT